VPGSENLTVAWNVNELGDVAGWYFPSGSTGGQLVGYVEVGGRYTPVPDTAIPTGSNVGAQNVTPWGEVMAGYTTPDGTNYELIDVNGTVTTIYDPDAYYMPSGGTSGQGASMTGEIVGAYTDTTAIHAWHGFVYANGQWATVDCPAGHGYIGSELAYVSDFGRHMLAACWTANTEDWYIYTPDRTFSSSPANFTLLPPPPGTANYLYGFVNDLGLAGGTMWPFPATSACPSGVQDAFVNRGGQFTTIAPQPGRCYAYANGANDLGVLALTEWSVDGSAVNGFLVTPGF
jgi:hypothetical protein